MALMVMAAVGSVLLLRPLSSVVRRYPAAVIAAAVLFQPLLASLIGGQNTAVTMLLISGAARAEASGHPILAGTAVGLLAYKPQYGIPLALVIGLSGKWRVVGGIASAWGALYLAGVAVLGWGWVGPWWENASAFRDTNATANGDLFISWSGYAEHIAGMGGSSGRLLAVMVGGLGVIAMVWVWRRRPEAVAARYAVAALGLVLIAPQSLFYEAGIGAIALLLLADVDGRVRPFALGAWIGGWLYIATAPALNTTILVLLLSATLALAVAASMGEDGAARPTRAS
jgi:hypothetical protein